LARKRDAGDDNYDDYMHEEEGRRDRINRRLRRRKMVLQWKTIFAKTDNTCLWRL
jgi:hypothetical protein